MSTRKNNRQRILETARKHFLQKSYHGATLREIAQAADVTTGSVYHYFSGKDELFVEVCMEGIRKLKKRVNTVAELTQQRPMTERVLALFDAYAAFYLEDDGYFDLLERLYLYTSRLNIRPDAAEQVWLSSKQILEQMGEILKQAEPGLDSEQINRRVLFAVAMAEGLIAAERKGFLKAFDLGLGSFRSTMSVLVDQIVLQKPKS